MHSDRSHHCFIRLFFITSLCLILAIVFFNYAIDPFNLFSSSSYTKNYLTKREAETNLRLIKAVEINNQRPKVLLLGSSRVRVGLHEDHYPHPKKGLIANIGLPGTTVEELESYLKHALYNQPKLHTVVLGLDLFMFNRNRKINVEYEPQRMNRHTMSSEDYLGLLFSFHALKNSFSILFDSLTHKAYSSPEKSEPRSTPAVSDADRAFLRDIMIAHEWYGKYEIDPKQILCFERIVQICKKEEVDLKVFISPAQAIYWEAVSQKKLWPQLDSLKIALSNIYPILDFSGFNPVTTLACQKKGDSFYGDCSHYSRTVGKMIFDKLFSTDDSREDFGFWLLPETIQGRLNEMKEKKDEWEFLNPALVQLVQELSS